MDSQSLAPLSRAEVGQLWPMGQLVHHLVLQFYGDIAIHFHIYIAYGSLLAIMALMSGCNSYLSYW